MKETLERTRYSRSWARPSRHSQIKLPRDLWQYKLPWIKILFNHKVIFRAQPNNLIRRRILRKLSTTETARTWKHNRGNPENSLIRPMPNMKLRYKSLSSRMWVSTSLNNNLAPPSSLWKLSSRTTVETRAQWSKTPNRLFQVSQRLPKMTPPKVWAFRTSLRHRLIRVWTLSHRICLSPSQEVLHR